MLTISGYTPRMEQTARIEHQLCRRQVPRFRLAMPARLITLERHCNVVLEDLSEAGARLTLPAPHMFTVCVVKWLDFHAFAEVRWMRDPEVGLAFPSRLPNVTLEQTVRYARGLAPRVRCNVTSAHRP